MSLTSKSAMFGLAAIYLVAAIAFIGHVCKRLAAVRHGSDIRVVWYLFSLASTVTVLIGLWAKGKGALDANGQPHGAVGDAIFAALSFMLDLKGDITLFGTLVALVVVPQCVSWVLSGLSGCARAPIFVAPAFRFFFWSVLKSMVVVSGILFSVASFARIEGWNGMDTRTFLETSGAALILIIFSFLALHAYRDVGSMFTPSAKPDFVKLRRLLQRINAWMNRRMPKESDRVDSAISSRFL